MSKLKPRRKNPPVINVEVERRVTTLTDITYRPMDVNLLKKYFPSIYESVMQDRNLAKRSKGSKE